MIINDTWSTTEATVVREAVTRCLDSELVLTMARQRMLSRRARERMVPCNAMDNLEDEDGNTDEEKNGGQRRNPLMTACLIEKIVKLCKTHRSAADFDCGFGPAIVNTMKGIKNDMEGGPVESIRNEQQEQQWCHSLSSFVVVIDIF
jgi:hypothetical protein